MTRLLSILTILTFTSCNSQSDTPENFAIEADKSENTFAICFADIDTSNAGQSIACSAGTYKLINDKYVIRILHDFPIQLDSCYSITIDSTKAGVLTELLVFDYKDASLTNICSDILLENFSGPSRKLYPKSGEVIIGHSDPTELYGNKTQRTTILIKNLVFTDSKTGETIEITNELIWKVLNKGTPG